MTLEAIRYRDGRLGILDQLLLPHTTTFIPVNNTEDGWKVIKNMQVRGAPAIGIVGSLSFAVELREQKFASHDDLFRYVKEKLDFLVTARPTAVNMADAAVKLTALTKQMTDDGHNVDDIKQNIIKTIENMMAEDIGYCKKMGRFGADDILRRHSNQPVTILTHCNTGSLATAGYGTALGVVRTLHEDNKLAHVYCTETRPYNQGSRLTAYELVYEKMPATLICDSMASILMKQKGVSAVIVGADRIAANGDTANKIGTYQLAITAKYHGVPFYVVAPSTSCDLMLTGGDGIVIEERSSDEMTSVKGIPVAAKGIGVWNPAFDVTPAELITGGIVTEFGLFQPAEFKQKLQKALKK